MVAMAQTMTASRTTYQNNYPSSSPLSLRTCITHGIPKLIHHIPRQMVSTVSVATRTKPIQAPNGTTTANRITHKKSDFYKNGTPAEVIVIDSESPAPTTQSSTKRKTGE